MQAQEQSHSENRIKMFPCACVACFDLTQNSCACACAKACVARGNQAEDLTLHKFRGDSRCSPDNIFRFFADLGPFETSVRFLGGGFTSFSPKGSLRLS